jgi:hypothetical protein
MTMTQNDPRTWFLDIDRDGWFIADADPEAGDVFGTRYATQREAKKALDDLVANYLANEGKETS